MILKMIVFAELIGSSKQFGGAESKTSVLLMRGDFMKNKIAELRKERSMTQMDLARAVQVSRQTIISLENGKYNPSIILAYKLAKIFETTIEGLFIFEESDLQ